MNWLKTELIQQRDLLFENYLDVDARLKKWISGDLKVRSSNDPTKTRDLIRMLKEEKLNLSAQLVNLDGLICPPDRRLDGLEEVY